MRPAPPPNASGHASTRLGRQSACNQHAPRPSSQRQWARLDQIREAISMQSGEWRPCCALVGGAVVGGPAVPTAASLLALDQF